MAQEPYFDHLTINDGLSNNTVYAITQDQNGFIWFGTRDGLCRFDGYNFSILKKEDKPGHNISGNQVIALFEDKYQNLWVGLRDGGTQILEYNTQQFKRPSGNSTDSINWERVTASSFFEDSNGNLWIGTLGMGVFKYNFQNDSIYHFVQEEENPKKKILNNFCFSFTEDADGNIWMGLLGNGLNYWNPKNNSIHSIVDTDFEGIDLYSYDKTVLAIGDKVWIGTEGNGIYIFDTNTRTFTKHLLSRDLVKDLVLNPIKNTVLVATDGQGLFVFNEEGVQLNHFTYSANLANSLNSNALYDLYFDHDQNLWIGTFNGGINIEKAQKARFFSYLNTNNSEDAPGFNSVLSFCESTTGRIWIGTDGGGLLEFDKNNGTFYRPDFKIKDLDPKIITTIHEDKNGTLWLGTFNNGLVSFDPASGEFQNFINQQGIPNSLFNNNVWAIEEEENGDLWLGLLGGGLQRLSIQKEEFRSFINRPNDSTSISGWNIRALKLDQDNNLWIGTELNGLNVMRNSKVDKFERWAPFSKKYFPSYSILSFFENGDFLWIGTEGDGLIRFNKKTFEVKIYGVKDGLASMVVNSIQMDAKGIFWLGTNGGLSSFDTNNEIFTNYNFEDGLQSNQFNPNASFFSKDGNMYFGGINGFNVFNPNTIPLNTILPKLAFTEFKVFNEAVKIGENRGGNIILNAPINEEPEICLDYWQNAFTISFAALEFTNPSKNQYAYKLDGFDDDWIKVGADARQANYTNLDPGKYTFLLKASNNNGVWSEEVKKLSIEVFPPFWKTWWFRLLMIIFISSLVIAYFQYLTEKRKEKHRQEMLKAEQKILLLENDKLANEVKQKNSELSAALLQAAHKNTELKGLKENLSELTQREENEPGQKREIKKLIRRINSEIDSVDYWEQFQLNFDQVHQQFSQRMHKEFPKLTQNDIRLSCLIKIGLTNKEIASIQNVSLAAIEKSKYRLKQKLDLDKDSDLNNFIMDFN
jgi:ligand-binding sensor domain-containing protein/DNA-binding CsgD family transcriptional regulator